MNTTQIKYSEVVLLHCIGALMIFCGHVSQVLTCSIVGEMLITGVPLFLFVSGFLSGCKSVTYNKCWLKRKANRILLPYYLLLFLVFCICMSKSLVQHSLFQIKPWLIMFTNIQGLTNFLFTNDLIGYSSPLSDGLGHFWFVTIIMLCYLIIPLINCCYERYKVVRDYWSIFLLFSFFVLQPLFVFYGTQLNYINVFILGFFVAKKGIEIGKKKNFLLATLALLILVGLRFIFRDKIDGSVFYDKYISLISSDAIGLWIVVFVFFLRDFYPKLIDSISKYKLLVWFDSIIYEFYLIHHLFVKGDWSICKWGGG